MSLPKRKRKLLLAIAEITDDKNFAQNHFLAVFIGQFDTNTERPGTVDTRADSADIERAISSDRPITRTLLDPAQAQARTWSRLGPDAPRRSRL